MDYSSGAQNMRHKLAGKMPLNSATVEDFRKDFLLLMKNTSRIKRDEALLATWRKAMLKWYGRFEEFGAQIRADLEGRIRANKHKPDYEQKVNLQWAQYYLDNMKPFWDFAWELRSIPNLDLPKSESLEDLKARLLGLDYAKQNGWDAAYVDNYIQDGIARGHVQTPETVAAKAWDVWDEEARKWDSRIKGRARGAWKYLNDLAAWTERAECTEAVPRPLSCSNRRSRTSPWKGSTSSSWGSPRQEIGSKPTCRRSRRASGCSGSGRPECSRG